VQIAIREKTGKVLMKIGLACLAAIVAVFALRADATAQQAVVKVAYTGPQLSPGTQKVWIPWFEQMEKESGGALKFDVAFGGRLASMVNVYDRLVSDVFQMGYGIQGVVVGKFPGTSVVQLPFLTENNRSASIALWKLYETGVLADEYSETVPIALFTFPQSNLHTKKLVKSLEDLKGLQIGATSDTDADLLKRFGAVPVSLSIADFYQAASQGVVAGVASPWTGVTNFKLQEVLPYHLEVPMGLSPGFMLMNKKAFAALPDNLKALLRKNSGYDLSKRIGRVYGEEIARDQYNEVVKLGGHTMTKLDGAEAERWRKLAEPQIDAWLSRDPNRSKILDAYRAALATADKDQ